MIIRPTEFGVGVRRTAYGSRKLFEMNLSARHRTDPSDYEFYYGAPSKPSMTDVTLEHKPRLDLLLEKEAFTFSGFYAESGALVGTVRLTPYVVNISREESGVYNIVIGGRTSLVEASRSGSWTAGFERGDNSLYSCLNILRPGISNAVASVLGQNHYIKWD